MVVGAVSVAVDAVVSVAVASVVSVVTVAVVSVVVVTVFVTVAVAVAVGTPVVVGAVVSVAVVSVSEVSVVRAVSVGTLSVAGTVVVTVTVGGQRGRRHRRGDADAGRGAVAVVVGQRVCGAHAGGDHRQEHERHEDAEPGPAGGIGLLDDLLAGDHRRAAPGELVGERP